MSDAYCSTILLTGKGTVTQDHLDKLGMYELSEKISNGKIAYKLTGKEYFLHWSPENSWMVTIFYALYIVMLFYVI